MMDLPMAVNDTELRIKGIEVLNRELGPVLALRFLSLLHREPTDYVEVSRRHYVGQNIDEVIARLMGKARPLLVGLFCPRIYSRQLSTGDAF